MTTAVAELPIHPPPILNAEMHRSILYVAGIDPSTNAGMANLIHLKGSTLRLFVGADAVVTLVRLGNYAYAFGADARVVRVYATGIGSVACPDGGGVDDWEAFHSIYIDFVMDELTNRKFPVAIVGEIKTQRGFQHNPSHCDNCGQRIDGRRRVICCWGPMESPAGVCDTCYHNAAEARRAMAGGSAWEGGAA